MLLSDLIEGLPIDAVRGDPSSVRVADLTEDSRTVLPGSLFVARRGLNSDGLAFIPDAVRAGAVAVLTEATADLGSIPDGPALLACEDARAATAHVAERLHGNPSRRLLVIGITGTNGKSTVAHLVHGLLNRCGVRCGLIGTVGIDDGTGFAQASMTTPPAIELSRTLATMVDAGCDAAAMEVSSHALDQRRADAIGFNAAVFTNITGDHQNYHPSFEHYLGAKQRLLEMLGGDAPGILNADDERVRGSAGRIGSGRAVLCSAGPSPTDAAWTVTRGAPSIEGESLTIRHRAHTIASTIPLIGAFNAMNACQAVASAWSVLGCAGMDDQERARRLADALSLATAPKGRLEPVHGAGDDVSVFVDYAHTDDALDRVLGAVRSVSDGELTVVFGAGGDRDRGKRPRMGAAAARHADRIVLTSDNPRSEPPSRIVADIMDGIPADARRRTLVHIDRQRAIDEAIIGAAPRGVVVVAGKGHETDQTGADAQGRTVTRRFVDQDVARAALATRRADAGAARTLHAGGNTMTGLVRTLAAGGASLDPDAIAGVIRGTWLARPGDGRPVLGAAIDSRRVRPGNLFFALRGGRTDGHRFLAAARTAGAAAAVVEDDPATFGIEPGELAGLGIVRVASARSSLRALASAYRDELTGLRVVGVTGSNGKTTTVRLIHAALEGAGLTGTRAQKSENNDLGVPLTILNADPAHDYLICEIGTNAPGEIADLSRLARPNIGVITSIGRAHIERLGSVAGIAREKAELVRAVPSHGVAIITGDSSELDLELSESGGGVLACRTVRVGISPGSDVTVGAVEGGSGGTRFEALGRSVRVPLPGAHNAVNGAIALAVAHACGAELDAAGAGLRTAEPPAMRLERSTLRIPGGAVTLVNDAYNANPESVAAAIRMLAAGEFDPAGDGRGRPRRVAVLGDMLEMGGHAREAHREILGLARGASGVDLTLCVGPVFAEAAGAGEDGVVPLGGGDDWIADAAARLADGDVVLLKGSRGMRLERLIGHLGDAAGTAAGAVGY